MWECVCQLRNGTQLPTQRDDWFGQVDTLFFPMFFSVDVLDIEC